MEWFSKMSSVKKRPRDTSARCATRRRALRAIVAVALAACVAVVVHGCGGNEDAGRAPRVLLIGIDGLDWDRVQRLSGEGRLPHLTALMEEGSAGVLHSVYPYLSPSVWTSIATGKREEKHGIAGFLVDRGRTTNPTPTSSNMRRARAVWQILNDAGYSAGVIGWLVTWPAEAVDGYMISSRFQTLLRDDLLDVGDEERIARKRQSLHPPEIWDEAVSLKVPVESVDDETVSAFLGDGWRDARDPAAAPAIEEFRRIYAADETALAFAQRFFKARPTDLAAVYLRGLDTSCHMYWRYMEPETWPHELSDELVSVFEPLIERYYERVDAAVGELLEHRGPGTVVILCSDHGFAGHSGYPGFEGELAVGISMHREDGIIIAAGPGIERGGRVEGASILDVTPTVLALLDVPVGRDMDGRVLSGLMTSEWLDEHPVGFVESHEVEGAVTDDEPIPSPVDEQVIEQLRTLGYID